MDVFNIFFNIILYSLIIIINYPPNAKTETLDVKTVSDNPYSGYSIKRFLILSTMLLLSMIMNLNVQLSYVKLIIGFMVMVFGYLRIWCFVELGQMFTYTLQIKNNHRLIETGPYRFLIHPSYTAQIGAMILYLTFIRAYYLYPLIIMGLIKLPARMQAEEDMMRAEFGNEYDAYVRNRWKIIPFIY